MQDNSRRLVDYHVHSTHSIDGRSSMDELCRRAIELKLDEVGFCEHVEFEPSDPALNFFVYERYSEAIDQARSRYAGKLTIRKGAEVDYGFDSEANIRAWLEGKDFDYLVGSVHYVDHVAFDLHKNLPMPPITAAKKYYLKMRQAAESKLFNVIGHFDLIRNCLPVGLDGTSAASTLIDGAFERMAVNKICLEVNSRRRENREPFPSRRLIRRYLEKGGELFSLGSDAHSARTLGVGVVQAMEILRDITTKPIHMLFE